MKFLKSVETAQTADQTQATPDHNMGGQDQQTAEPSETEHPAQQRQIQGFLKRSSIST
jgi:hypothetical protein